MTKGDDGKMAKTAARVGRKPRLASVGQRMSLGLKVTPEIKNKLDAACKLTGRTQSQEAEVRLEQTFRTENYVNQATVLAYGAALATALAIIGRAVSELNRHAEFPQSWIVEPHLVDEVIWASDAVLG